MAEVQVNPTDIIHAPTMVCKCGCKVFQEGFVLKKLSPLVTGGLTEEFYPIPVYVCSKCGEIPAEFLEKGNAKAILGDFSSTVDTEIEEA